MPSSRLRRLSFLPCSISPPTWPHKATASWPAPGFALREGTNEDVNTIPPRSWNAFPHCNITADSDTLCPAAVCAHVLSPGKLRVQSRRQPRLSLPAQNHNPRINAVLRQRRTGVTVRLSLLAAAFRARRMMDAWTAGSRDTEHQWHIAHILHESHNNASHPGQWHAPSILENLSG